MTFWSGPGQPGQDGVRYLTSLFLEGQRQAWRDHHSLPQSALGMKHQTSHKALLTALPITECHIPERVSTSGASAATFSPPSLPGNYERARKGEFLQAAQQPTAPHDSHKTPRSTAMLAGPGGSSGSVTHLPAKNACHAF